jgi:hypothetical protein
MHIRHNLVTDFGILSVLLALVVSSVMLGGANAILP